MLVHTGAAVLGLSTLLAASATAFAVVKVVGAVYLCWLGLRALRESWSRPIRDSETAEPQEAPPTGPGRAFRQGFLTDVFNPKAPLIFISVLPQFMSSDRPAVPQTLLLSAVLIGCALPWYLGVALVVTQINAILGRAIVRRWFDRVTGGVFVALGVSLFLTRQPDAG